MPGVLCSKRKIIVCAISNEHRQSTFFALFEEYFELIERVRVSQFNFENFAFMWLSLLLLLLLLLLGQALCAKRKALLGHWS